MIAQAVPDWKKPDLQKNWGRMLAFSLGLHLLLLIFFFQLVPRGQAVRPLEAAYTVNLISPGEGPAGGPEAPRAADPAPLPPSPKPVSPKEIPPTRAVEKPPPSALEDPQSLDKALEKIKKKIDQEKNLERSFHQLENKVKNQETLGQALARLERKQAKAEKTGEVLPVEARAGPESLPPPVSRVRGEWGCNFKFIMPPCAAGLRRIGFFRKVC